MSPSPHSPHAPHAPHALNALFEALGATSVPNSCDLVVLAGPLARERLRVAIATTLARQPVLAGASFDLRFHSLATDDPARIDAHLLELIWRERLAPGLAPVRFHVTETPRRTYLQTIHTHVYADATACYVLTEQIAAAYAGRTPDLAPRRGATAAATASAALRRAATDAAQRLAGVALTARDLATPYAGLATPPHAAPGRRRLARYVFTPAETARLRQAARARGCSMHAFFQLSFLRTALDFNQARGVTRSELRLWDFFSVRPLRDQAAAYYDCLALVYPVDLDGRWTDDEVLARCAANVERMRGGEILRHDARFAALFALFGRRLPLAWFARLWPAMFKSNIVLTNPGVVPSRLPSFGEVPVLEYVTFPQLFHPADVMFVFSTFRDGLRVLAVYDEDALAAGFHGELFEPFLRGLGSMAGLDLSSVHTEDGFVAGWERHATNERMTA